MKRLAAASALAMLGLGTAVAGPTGATGATGSASVAPATTASGPAAAGVLSPLAVVDKVHGGRFVVSSTHQTFVMRGFDYQPLGTITVDGKAQYVNDTFEPSFYRHASIVAVLKQWQADRYNTVRVFLNPNQIGNVAAAGLDQSYVSNVADFLTTAAQYGIRTLITVGALPPGGGYTPNSSRAFGIWNQDYLNPTFVASENRYLTALIAGLRGDGAPLADVLWELKGEQDWDNRAAPLSWKGGLVKAADGKTYNMAVATSRAAMENDSLVYWTNSLTSTIHRLIPGSLVSVGVYPPSVKRPAWTVRPQLLFTSATKTDFVDIHIYPNLGTELEQVNSFGGGSTAKPVIMGEFGVTRQAPVAFGSKQLVSWQEASCHIGGLSVSGWLLWTWNSSAQVEFWDALADGGVLERALAPIDRPNPCR